MRGGYGIFYQQTDRYGSESQLGLNLPQLVDAAITRQLRRRSRRRSPSPRASRRSTPSTVNPSVVQWRIQDPDQDTPIVHQFSIGPEYQLTDTMVAAVEYVGNRTRNGRRLRNLNQGVIQPDGSSCYPYAQYGYGSAFLEQIVTNGRADYDSLQMRMQKRMSDGLAYTLAYTWSEALGDFLDHLSAGGGATGNFPQDAYNMAADYGPLAFDIPHRFVASAIYELPFGAGRRYLTERRGRGDPRRLVGERHPHAERRPAVHGDGATTRPAPARAASRAPTASATRCPTASTRRSTPGST